MSNTENNTTRRNILKGGLSLVVLGAGFSALSSACGGKKELRCDDTSGLSAQDLSMRTTLKYVDASPQADKNCTNCIFFVAGQPNACGTCKLVKGPISPKGYCTSWAAKPA